MPWIALTLAGSWACYGILRKKSHLGSLAGLTVETMLLLPFAVALLLWRVHTGEGAPTVQFLIGLFVYHEPFDSARFQAFALIWCGLVIYSAAGFWSQRRVLLRATGAA